MENIGRVLSGNRVSAILGHSGLVFGPAESHRPYRWNLPLLDRGGAAEGKIVCNSTLELHTSVPLCERSGSMPESRNEWAAGAPPSNFQNGSTN